MLLRIGLLAGGLFFTASASADLVSSFDSDLEGWTKINDVTLFHEATGGNPDGYMRLVDAVTGVVFSVSAPDKFLGDLSAADGESMRFDSRLLASSGSALNSFGLVTISGSSGSAELDFADTLTMDWQTFSKPMTAEAWGVTQPQWDALLSNVTSITIGLEYIQGSETIGFDNFTIVPEPTALALLGIGSLLVSRRRHRVAGQGC